MYRLAPTGTAHARQPRTGRLRVTLVGPSSQYCLGGQETQLQQLAANWSGDNTVAACLVPFQPTLPAILRFTERIPLVRTLVRLPFYASSLFRAMDDTDVVHVFSGSYSSFLIATAPALLIAAIRGKETIVNYRSCKASEHLRRSPASRFALQKSGCIVVSSAYLAGIFEQFQIPTKIVPNSVDLREFRYRRRMPLRPLLICTRNFNQVSGVDLVIGAYAEVERAFPGARLSLVGTGDQEPLLRRLVQDLRLRGVEFAGRVERNRMAAAYRSSDIFINGSRDDNAPNSILEAFASGLPVVSSAAGGIPWIVRNQVTGLLSEAGDWESLAGNVIRLLRDQDLADKLARNGYMYVQQHNWTTIRSLWLAVYESVVSMS